MVEHYVDIVGVTSSNLVAPTISRKGFKDIVYYKCICLKVVMEIMELFGLNEVMKK